MRIERPFFGESRRENPVRYYPTKSRTAATDESGRRRVGQLWHALWPVEYIRDIPRFGPISILFRERTLAGRDQADAYKSSPAESLANRRRGTGHGRDEHTAEPVAEVAIFHLPGNFRAALPGNASHRR